MIHGRSVHIFTRNGHDWTSKFAPVAEAASRLPALTAIIYREMIVTDTAGKPDFTALRSAIRSAPGRLRFVAFDILLWNRRDLRKCPMVERRKQLWSLV